MTNREFEKFIYRQKDNMFRFALSILKNNENAEDAVQEIALRLWRNKNSLDKFQNPESYCLKTLKNYCLDELRKQNHRSNYHANHQAACFNEPEVENLDMVEKIKQELDNLPTQQRMAIELKDFLGYSYEEISEILEMNVTAIRVNVSRGKKKLNEIFKEELEDA